MKMAMSKVLFSVLEDEKLIEVVAKFSCLYDLASPVYKNQLIKDNAWKEVAEQVERSGKNKIIYKLLLKIYILLSSKKIKN